MKVEVRFVPAVGNSPNTLIMPVLTHISKMSPEAQATGKDLIGHWEGEMVREGAGLQVDYDFSENAGSIEGRFSCATQRVMEYPLDAVRYAHPQLHFELGGEIIFDGKLTDDIITGTFREGGAQGTRRTPPPKLPYDVDEVRFDNGDVTLGGALLTPSRKGPWPAIVFLHGSGPDQILLPNGSAVAGSADDERDIFD